MKYVYLDPDYNYDPITISNQVHMISNNIDYILEHNCFDDISLFQRTIDRCHILRELYNV